MRKSLWSLIASSVLALAPAVLGQEEQARKDTLVVYQSTQVGTHQAFLLREVKKRYGNSAEYTELSPNFPNEIISKEKQEELIKNNGKPEQVLILADYRSFTPESVVTANKWIRNLDSDPFPDARIAFFPSHPKYASELTALIYRQHYDTSKALTRFDDQVISFAKEGIDISSNKPTIGEKKNGVIEVKSTKDQSRAYAEVANSGQVDYIARFGHSGPGFWQSTDQMNGFWLVGMDRETLLINPGTKALKSRKVGEKFVGELDLEELIRRDKQKPFQRIGSLNPKILDNWACCSSILPPEQFQGREFSTVISNMAGNNAFVWGYEKEVTYVPQAGAHQLLFWGTNGANSFTESLLGSQVFVTAEREKLERSGQVGLDCEILKSDEFSGMLFGLPDNLTRAKTSSRMYDQDLDQKRRDGITTTKLDLELKKSTDRNDYRMRMWSPPVVLLPQEINPTSINQLKLTIDGIDYQLPTVNRGTYSTAKLPDNLSGEITLIDNAIVMGIAPIYKDGKSIYREIKEDQKISITFDSK